MFTIFIGAFLLFQVQPLIAKMILPFFGGGAAVWTACLLFFQAVLFLGYLYAHLLSSRFIIKKQIIIHVILLLISSLFLPLSIPINPELLDQSSPLTGVLSALFFAIGLPYFLLSATGPLVQKWLADVYQNNSPYKLYSLSNIASLAALLSFPFLFEANFSLQENSQFWSIVYSGYVIAFVFWCWLILNKIPADSPESNAPKSNNIEGATHSPSVNKLTKFLWLALSSIGVILLVSTTNAMTQNVPPVPFLWILPLCIYLATFIVCFNNTRWYKRSYWFVCYLLVSAIAILMYFMGSQFDIVSQIVLYSVILFVACMICHAELVNLKPSVHHLTLFYLLISLGGFLGSAFVAFVAQNLFTQFFEYPIAIIAVFILISIICFTHEKRSLITPSSLVVSVVFTGTVVYLNLLYVKTNIASERNFYGVLSVKDVTIDGAIERRLIDGTTSHGTQSLMPELENQPLSYYRKDTGAAILLNLDSNNNNGKRVAFIGMGAGALAAYGTEKDDYTFFELNPAVINAAEKYFTFTKNSKADINIVQGDARVSLQKELFTKLRNPNNQEKRYNAFILDAFSGDSIPQHLLTIEAFNLYWQLLDRRGVIAVHISNSHLNLKPVMAALAEHYGVQLRYFKTKAKLAHEHDTEWVWLTKNKVILDESYVRIFGKKFGIDQPHILWTDQKSDLLSILK